MGSESETTLTRRDFAVAGVSFLVSGLGGAYLQKWFSRAKPSIDILSFGFDGTAEQIKLSEELQQKSKADNWGDTLTGTETFEKLRDRYGSNLSLIRKHEELIPIVERWVLQYKPRLAKASGSNSIQIDSTEIDTNAFMQNEIFGSALIGNISRLEISEPPITDFSNLDYRPTVLDRSDKEIVVQNGSKLTRFPLTRMNAERKRRLMTLMAESYARGVLHNIIFYSEFFLTNAKDDLLKLKALEAPLKELLTREARLTVRVALRNAGEAASIFRQYYSAVLTAKSYSKTILMTQIDADQKKKSTNEDNDNASPKSDDLAKLLPSAKGGQLLSIAAGEVKQLTLQSLKALGEDGAQIVTFFQNDIIECEVYGFLSGGKRLGTGRVPFGRSAIDNEQKEVVKQSSQ